MSVDFFALSSLFSMHLIFFFVVFPVFPWLLMVMFIHHLFAQMMQPSHRLVAQVAKKCLFCIPWGVLLGKWIQYVLCVGTCGRRSVKSGRVSTKFIHHLQMYVVLRPSCFREPYC